MFYFFTIIIDVSYLSISFDLSFSKSFVATVKVGGLQIPLRPRGSVVKGPTRRGVDSCMDPSIFLAVPAEIGTFSRCRKNAHFGYLILIKGSFCDAF